MLLFWQRRNLLIGIKITQIIISIKEEVLDGLVGTESAERVLDKIVDKATDVDGKIYNLLLDYINNNKSGETPSEDEISDIITEKVEEEVSVEEIEDEIQKMQDVNGNDGISNEYWNSRF